MDTPIDRYVRSYVGDEPRGGLTRDVAFNRKSFSDDQPENPAQGDIHVGLDGIRAELIQDYDDADLQRVCTFAINATRGIDPEDPPDLVDWEEMLQGGLQTALEDFRITFAIYGVSRTGTHQIVRTRQAAFHQQSQRAHYYGDRPSVRMPESFVGKKAKVAARNGVLQYREDREYSVDQEFENLAEHAAWFYRLATVADISYQDARFGLLEGTENFILWEGSLREFINVYAYRGCSMFQWEIVAIFRAMRKTLVEAHPYLDKYVKISCEKTHGNVDGMREQFVDEEGALHVNGTEAVAHACTYQGWEAVTGQCDFPWARDTNRTFRSTHHRIEKGTVNVAKPVENKKAPLRDQMTAAMEPKLNNP
jgi:flavin-dependent thymidylate synthase